MAKGRGGRTSRGEEYRRNQRILEQMKNYGIDPEDFDDFVALGDRPGQVLAGGMEGLVPVAPYAVDDGKGAAWDKRLKELQDRAKKRRDAQKQRDVEDYDARIRRQETPTQAEARKAEEAARAAATTAAVAPAQPTAPSTPALNPASGAKRAPAPARAPLVSIGRNDRTGTTITVNGQGMRPTTENVNLVNGIQRQQLLDAPTGVDVTSPLYTNAEVRLMRRNAAQIQMWRDGVARREAILAAGRKRSDEISWNRGEVRNARDWEHYGTVASAEGWKKGSDEYNSSMTALRDKMKTLQGMADAGYMPSTGKAMAEFSKLIEGSDADAGLTQKQVEVANKQLDSWLGGAQNRQARIEAGNAYRINQLRNRMGLAEGTSASDVLAADRAARGRAVSGALDALRDPNVWNGPDYYKHLETIQRNAGPNEGLASSFKAAMRDPATRQRYNDAVTNLTGGGMLPDDEGVADLQNKFAIEHMQAQRSATPTVASPAALTDEEKRRLGIQAAQGAGTASGSLRPRKEYASDKERYRDMGVAEKLVRAGELLKKYEGTDKYDAFKKRYDAMLEKYGPQVQAVKQGIMEVAPVIDSKVAGEVAARMPWDYERNRITTPHVGRPDGTVDYGKINAIASSPIPERVTSGLGTSVSSAQPLPSYRTDLGGLGTPGSLWLQPLRPRGKGVL